MNQCITVDLDLVTALRIESKLKMKEIATYLGYKTPTGYWLLENGERKINVNILFKLSKLYKKTMESFILTDGK